MKQWVLIFLVALAGYMASYASEVSTQTSTPIVQNKSAKDFFQSIYANYHKNGPIVDYYALFSPNLLKLFNEESKLEKGPSILNGDPFCDCQEYEEVKIKSMLIKEISSTQANVKISFTIFNDTKDIRILKFNLVKINELWYVNNIYTPASKWDLRAELQKEIKKLQAYNSKHRANAS